MSKKVLTKQLKTKIAELVSTGLNIKQALKKLDNPVQPNTIYKEQLKDKEFNELMDIAFSCHLMAKSTEFDEVCNVSASEAYPELEFREAAELLKRKVDGLKFILSKLAPQHSKRWDRAQKVEHSGQQAGITIVLSDFHMQEPIVSVTDSDTTKTIQ